MHLANAINAISSTYANNWFVEVTKLLEELSYTTLVSCQKTYIILISIMCLIITKIVVVNKIIVQNLNNCNDFL